MRTWGFLTNHAHVLIQIARNPRTTVREIALESGITERAAISVLQDLRRSGIARASREGRQNVYWVDTKTLAKHRPWGASPMEIPDALVSATVAGVTRLVESNGARPKPPAASPHTNGDDSRRWGFLTNHALVLINIIGRPHSTVREIALEAGITERATHAVLQDLSEAGIVDRERRGRRNSYSVNFANLEGYRREGTAPDLVPSGFVSFLMSALVDLRPAP